MFSPRLGMKCEDLLLGVQATRSDGLFQAANFPFRVEGRSIEHRELGPRFPRPR